MKRTFLISFAVGVSVIACLAADSEEGFVTIFDGKTFDPANPEEYARSFAVHNIKGQS